MIDEIQVARDAALRSVASAETVEQLEGVVGEHLGKRGALSQLKTKLGSLATIDEKKAMGQALNEALDRKSTRLNSSHT